MPPTQQDVTNANTNTNKQSNKKKKKKKKGGGKSEQEPPSSSLSAIKITKKLKFRVQLIFEMESIEWIPPLRLLPNRSNLANNNASKQQPTPTTTPFYNFTLTEDASYDFISPVLQGSDDDDVGNDHHHHSISSSCFTGALVLAKIWCLQRGFLRCHDGFDTNQIALLLVYLFRTKQVNSRMTPLQVIAAMFKLISQTNWFVVDGDESSMTTTNSTSNLIRKAPSERYQGTITSSSSSTTKRKQRCDVLVMPAVGKTESQTIAQCKLAKLYEQQVRESPLTKNDPRTLKELYQQQQQGEGEEEGCCYPAFLDSTMTYNFFGRISPSFMKQVQRQALKSLDCMHQSSSSSSSSLNNNPFTNLFMKSARFWSKYDAYLRVPLDQIQFDKSMLWGSNRHDIGEYESVARGIVSVLRQALGDRIHEISILSTGNGLVDDDDHHPSSLATSNDSAAVNDSDEIPSYEVATTSSSSPSTGGGSKSNSKKQQQLLLSPTGKDYAVLGLTLNSDTCFRVVDRGPPADDDEATQRFQKLWGNRAQLRRFKDGAIVYAVVWDNNNSATPSDNGNANEGGASTYIRYQNDDKLQGGIVERIVQHILRLHFLKELTQPPQHNNNATSTASLQFSLRDIMSVIDGVLIQQQQPGGENDSSSNNRNEQFDPLVAHRNCTKAFQCLSEFLRDHSAATATTGNNATSNLGLPLPIDAVEALSPALRYAELFPPTPHPWLGGGGSTASVSGVGKKISGAIMSDPIEIQIRFGPSSKWPTDIKAMGAAKTAMLVKLVDGIEAMKKRSYGGGVSNFYGGHSCITPTYADISFMGYVFRIRVRADPELKLLEGLSKPNARASSMLNLLTKRHVVQPLHHCMIHSVYTKNPSSSAVVRLAKRWLSSHLFSGHIPFEAIELLVAYVYTSNINGNCTALVIDPPGTVVAGFLRFLQLLGNHDWAREPLIVDPQQSLTNNDVHEITEQFEQIRGSDFSKGPPMYIISPSDRAVINNTSRNSNRRSWVPSFTTSSCPESVVFARAVKLANCSYAYLRKCLVEFHHLKDSSSWQSAFLETTQSFRSYSALLRIDPEFVLDPSSSSTAIGELAVKPRPDKGCEDSCALVLESSWTRGVLNRYKGPKPLQRIWYKNINNTAEENKGNQILMEWKPIDSCVDAIRDRLGHLLLVFYNDLCPDVISLLWRPTALKTFKAFSAMNSEFALPSTTSGWQHDTLVTVNVSDILREISQFTKDIVIDVKVFDEGLTITCSSPSKNNKNKRKLSVSSSSDDSSDSSDSNEGESQ